MEFSKKLREHKLIQKIKIEMMTAMASYIIASPYQNQPVRPSPRQKFILDFQSHTRTI